MSLKDFLAMGGPVDIGGLRPVVQRAEREGGQLREAVVGAATAEAEGLKQVGEIKGGTLATLGQQISKPIAKATEFKRKKELKKLELKAEDIKAEKKFAQQVKLEKVKAALKADTKGTGLTKEQKTSLNAVFDDFSSAVKTFREKAASKALTKEELLGFANSFSGRLADSNLQDSKFAASTREQMATIIGNTFAFEDIEQELETLPVFIDNPQFKNAVAANALKKDIKEIKIAKRGFNKRPTENQILKAYSNWGQQGTDEEFIQFLKLAKNGEVNILELAKKGS